jgi:hypothetical protein
MQLLAFLQAGYLKCSVGSVNTLWGRMSTEERNEICVENAG